MSDYKLIDVTRLTKFKEKLLGILAYSTPATDATRTSIEFIDSISQSSTNGTTTISKKKVSTFAGNTAGLVPAPGTNASGTFLGSDGKWSKPTGTTYSNYAYSTNTKDGANGLVPAPGTGDVGKFLKGGSGWSDLPTASTATNGAGIVALSNSTDSTSTTTAATSKAVNDVYTAAVNAASTAGTNAGKAAASSYATAAKNSADSASTYATNAKNSAASAASAADTAVTNKINALTGSTTDSTETSTTFISSISQTKGVVTATKKKLPTASTTTAGIVQLINSTGSTSTTTAATPNSVTQAINGLTGSVTDSSATETSTTFISDISQTNGVISATKKKLPTYTAGQGIKIENGVISVTPPTKAGNPTCFGYTLYGDYFLSDTIIPNKNWNEACDIIEGVTVTQNYSYGDAQINTVIAKALSKAELETLTIEQRKINDNGRVWYWTSTPNSDDRAWLVNSSGGFIHDKVTESAGSGGARLGFKNPFI